MHVEKKKEIQQVQVQVQQVQVERHDVDLLGLLEDHTRALAMESSSVPMADYPIVSKELVLNLANMLDPATRERSQSSSSSTSPFLSDVPFSNRPVSDFCPHEMGQTKKNGGSSQAIYAQGD